MGRGAETERFKHNQKWLSWLRKERGDLRFGTGITRIVRTKVPPPQRKLNAPGSAMWTSVIELLTLRGHTARVSSVAFTPDGSLLISAAWDGTVRFWRAGSRNP